MSSWILCSTLRRAAAPSVGELVGVLGEDRHLGGELVDALLPRAARGLVGAEHGALQAEGQVRARAAAASRTMVTQFGLATMPRCVVERLGVDLDDDERDLGVHAPGRRVVHDDGAGVAKCGAHSFERAPPAEKSARSKPSIVSCVQRLRRRAPSSSRPAERSEANGTISPRGEPALAQLAAHLGAHGAGGADDGDPVAVAHEATTSSPNGRSRRIPPAPSSNAACSARTASGTLRGADDAGDLDRGGRDHLDVDGVLAEGLEDLGGHAGMRAHARADDRDLAHLGVVGHAVNHRAAERGQRCRAPRAGRRAGR